MCILPFHVKTGGCERRYPWTGRQAGHGRQAVHSCIQLLVNHSFFSIHAFIQLKQSLLNHSTICFSFIHSTIRYSFIQLFVIHSTINLIIHSTFHYSFIQLFVIHSFNYSLFIHSTIRYSFIQLLDIYSFCYLLFIHFTIRYSFTTSQAYCYYPFIYHSFIKYQCISLQNTFNLPY